MGRSSSASGGDKVNQVQQLLLKDRLSKEQLEYCSRACIERYLRARGGNVRKAVKQLRASLAWRESLEMGYLTADDFTAELAAGTAFVAGHDDNGLPVVVVRMRQQFSGPRWSQKRFLRFLVFTFEVAVACMPPGVEQWVMLVDLAGSSASSSPSSSIFTILKLIADHYPERLAPSFFVDAPSMFYYLWKGMSPFVDYSTRDKWRFASSKDHIDACESSSCSSSSCTPSFRHTGGGAAPGSGSVGGGAGNGGGSYEDRLSAMSFLTPLSSPGGQSFFKRTYMDNSLSAALASDIQHRSLSFSSPANRTARTPEPARPFYGSPVFTRSSRSRRCSRDIGSSSGGNTIASLLGHNHRSSNSNGSGSTSSKSVDVAFRPYVRLCRSSYDESSYRATMKPPLGGLLSVIRNALTISSPSSTAPG